MDWIVVALLAIAGVLLLSSLDNGVLWQDEAETAVLARNTLEFGYPRAFDGRNLIEEPLGYGPHHAWVYHPWLPFYLLAGVFALAGESTWIARFPFALLGLLSLVLTWRLARRVSADPRVHRLSVALLTFSVPFLLHMRVCRYYALTMALVLGICLAYLRWFERRSAKRAAALGMLLVLLFHTQFGFFLPVMGVVVLHQLVWGRRDDRLSLWWLCGGVALLTVPWAVFFYRPAFVGTVTPARVAEHLEYYLRVTNKYLAPLTFMAVSGVWMWVWARWGRRRHTPDRASMPVITFLGLLMGAQLLFLLLPDQRHMRYLIPFLPLFAIGEAWLLVAWLRQSRKFGWLFIGFALFTTVLHSGRGHIPLAEYVYELTHRYEGPMEGIVGYLRAHSRPDETAKIPYDDRTLMFYTAVRLERPSEFLRETYPDWVILRRRRLPASFFESAYFRQIEAEYDRIELQYPDAYWQNRADPGEHHFRTPGWPPPVVLFRKERRVYD